MNTHSITCNFCGSSNGEVDALLMSPDGASAICSDCVGRCVEALEGHAEQECEEPKPAYLH